MLAVFLLVVILANCDFHYLDALATGTGWTVIKDPNDGSDQQRSSNLINPSPYFPGSRGRCYSCHIPGTTRFVVFGGFDSADYLDTTWEFDRSAGAEGLWTEMFPSPRPSSRDSGRLVPIGSLGCAMFGGYGGGSFPTDVWRYSPTSVFEELTLSTTLSQPSGRTKMAMWSDPDEETISIWGGGRITTPSGDPFFWMDITVPAGSGVWYNATTTNPPSPRWGAAAWTLIGSTPGSYHYYLYSGYDQSSYMGDMHRMDGVTFVWEEVTSSQVGDRTSTDWSDYVHPGLRSNSLFASYGQYGFVFGGKGGGLLYSPSLFMLDGSETEAAVSSFPTNQPWYFVKLGAKDTFAPGQGIFPQYPSEIGSRWNGPMSIMLYEDNLEFFIFGNYYDTNVRLDLWRVTLNYTRGLSVCGGVSALTHPETVCSGHGGCFEFDVCSCDSGWIGTHCTVPLCFGIAATDPSVCNDGQGTCASGVCECLGFWSGDECTVPPCDGIAADDPSVCSGEGTCVLGVCNCGGEWSGALCSDAPCDGIAADNVDVCNKHGTCAGGVCSCMTSWEGDFCQTDSTVDEGDGSKVGLVVGAVVGGIVGPVVLLLLVALLVAVVWFVGRYRRRRRPKVDKLDELEDQETAQAMAQLEIDQSLFTLDYKDLDIKNRIGQGGSGTFPPLHLSLDVIRRGCFPSVWNLFRIADVPMFRRWSNLTVAFKCFKIRDFSDQFHFEEFEKEVRILASVSHPGILRFHGATLSPPRVGILMEYCENGDIRGYLLNNPSMAFELRLRFLKEIANALLFLHSRQIIHRDLKCENVLVASDLSIRVMDFGLSRRTVGTGEAKTVRIGTSVYMAPEMTANSTYDNKVDVFSFGIMIFVISTGNTQPYDADITNVEIRVGSDPKFRPKFSSEEEEAACPPAIQKLMRRCWAADPMARPTFEMIFEELEMEETTDK